jgi:hypothetical protein
LVFSRELLIQALTAVNQVRKFDFGGDPRVETDWSLTIAKRLRCMMRHLRQTELKSPRVAWLKDFTRPPIEEVAGAHDSEEEDYEEDDDGEEVRPKSPHAPAPARLAEYIEMPEPMMSMFEEQVGSFPKRYKQLHDALMQQRCDFLEMCAFARDMEDEMRSLPNRELQQQDGPQPLMDVSAGTPGPSAQGGPQPLMDVGAMEVPALAGTPGPSAPAADGPSAAEPTKTAAAPVAKTAPAATTPCKAAPSTSPAAPARAVAASSAASSHAGDSEVAGETDLWMYGWDVEASNAWRVVSNVGRKRKGSKPLKEWACRIVVPPTAQQTTHVLAEWFP